MKHKTILMSGIAVLLIMVAVSALAHGPGRGWGRGYHMMGPGWHHRGGYGYGEEGYTGSLSEKEIADLDTMREEFLKDSEDMRQKLYEKSLALKSELAKENPDIGNASKLQGEISKLQAELDQKRLDYEIQARKAVPNYERSTRGYGPMMGYGRRGGGPCWQ